MRRLTFPVLALAWGCGVHIERPHASPDADSDVDTDSDADTGSDTGTEIETPTLVVREVVPDHGPPAGGNEIEIRGDGFGDTLSIAGLTVTIGGRLVETPDIEVVSPRSLRIRRVPPGDVGPADVGVHTAFDGDPIQDATLPDGYFYDVFSLDPPRGTIRGGTKVALTGYGTRWDESAIVTFDGAAATGCVVIGPERIDCRTPPGEPGDSDVRVTGGSGDAAFDDFVEDGFTYYESADPIGGGLGGGPIDGQIVVTVLDYYSRRPIEGAFCARCGRPDATIYPYEQRGLLICRSAARCG